MDELKNAKWIWLPSQRTLPNSFMLFKKNFDLREFSNARCYIFADSRYRIFINGKRVGFGPAPCDPHHQEADFYNITPFLVKGVNTVTVQVLFYGFGEGTWVTGKPGLILKLVIENPDGSEQTICSDDTWYVKIDRSQKNGNYKRWYLRSLQEECDMRLWDEAWLCNNDITNCVAARVYSEDYTAPSIALPYCEYMSDSMNVDSFGESSLKMREIPMLREIIVPAERKLDDCCIHWKNSPEDWFQFRMEGAYSSVEEQLYEEFTEIPDGKGVLLTYVFHEQMVGFPIVEIEADDGTIVEVMTQESHDESKKILLDTYYFTWSRFICKQGINRFEAFDYESVKYLQLHIHGGRARVKNISLRRRIYDWTNHVRIESSDSNVQRVMNAAVNTLYNNSLEIMADGMGRERQQYMGDLGHQLNALRYCFGEVKMSERVLTSFSYGQTFDGYYMDCWPGFDRCNRIYQRMIGLTEWGPIIDHGVQFVIECWKQFLFDGNSDFLGKVYKGIIRFCKYIDRLRSGGNTVPVENLGVEYVWIDHNAYKKQCHKECAFNLYIIGMLKQAVLPMLEALGKDDSYIRQLITTLEKGVNERFWDGETFVCNLPWIELEGKKLYCDRSLASAIVFDIKPECHKRSAEILANCPENLGISYPANAYWRYKALIKMGYSEVFFNEIKTIWANMTSVIKNNTLQEMWNICEDTTFELSHAPTNPLHLIYTDVLGLEILEAGCRKIRVNPRNDFSVNLKFRAYTPCGYIDYCKNGNEVTVIVSENYCESKLEAGVYILK